MLLSLRIFPLDNTNHLQMPVPSIDLEMSQHSLEEGQKITVPENNFNHLVDYESVDNKENKPKM
jgi:hypothetical protein